jgi:hypothetical protein
VAKRKRFTPGEAVEVRREPGSAWEPAAYGKAAGAVGHHWVNLPDHVPSIYLDPRSGMYYDEPDVEGRRYLTRSLIVPSIRVRTVPVSASAGPPSRRDGIGLLDEMIAKLEAFKIDTPRQEVKMSESELEALSIAYREDGEGGEASAGPWRSFPGDGPGDLSAESWPPTGSADLRLLRHLRPDVQMRGRRTLEAPGGCLPAPVRTDRMTRPTSTPSWPLPLSRIVLTIELTREADTPDQWTSHCLETDTISAGMTPCDALSSVAEAFEMMVADAVVRWPDVEPFDIWAGRDQELAIGRLIKFAKSRSTKSRFVDPTKTGESAPSVGSDPPVLVTTVTSSLLDEGRAHDAAMSKWPWMAEVHGSMRDDDFVLHGPDLDVDTCGRDDARGIAWMRNNLRALLDAYETVSEGEAGSAPSSSGPDRADWVRDQDVAEKFAALSAKIDTLSENMSALCEALDHVGIRPDRR